MTGVIQKGGSTKSREKLNSKDSQKSLEHQKSGSLANVRDENEPVSQQEKAAINKQEII